MKFSTYDPTVKTNNIQGEIRVPADRAAWGISTNSLDDAGKAFHSIGLAIGQRQEEADRQTILKAMNLYNQGQYGLMYNEEDGLMNTKLEGSDGIDGTYLSRERDLRSRVLGVTKLHSKKNMLALTNLMDKSAMQNFQNVDRHRQQQYEKVQDIQFEGNMNSVLDSVLRNPETVDEQIINTKRLVDLRYSGKNLGKEAMESIYRQHTGRVVTTFIDNAIVTENYSLARDALEIYGRDCLDENQRRHYAQNIYGFEKNRWRIQTAEEIAKAYGYNPLAIKRHINNMRSGFQGLSEEGGTWQRSDESVSLQGMTPTAQAAISDLAQELYDMSGEKLIITSGTDSTDIHASGVNSHANGVKIDVANEFFKNPENRKRFIRLAESKGVKVLDEYENPSANSTGEHLDLDLSGYTGGGEKLSPEEAERLYQKSLSKAREFEALKKQQEAIEYKNAEKAIHDYVFDTKNLSETDLHRKCYELSGGDLNKYNKYLAEAIGWGKVKYQISDKPKLTKEDFMDIKEALAGGTFKSYGDFIQAITSRYSLTEEQWKMASNIYGQWENKIGEFSIDVSKLGLTDILGEMPKDTAGKEAYKLKEKTLRRLAAQVINEILSEKAQRKEPREVNEIEVKARLQRMAQEQVIGYYKTNEKTFFGFDKYAPLLYSDTLGAQVGIANLLPWGNGQWFVQYEQTDPMVYKPDEIVNTNALYTILHYGRKGNLPEQDFELALAERRRSEQAERQKQYAEQQRAKLKGTSKIDMRSEEEKEWEKPSKFAWLSKKQEDPEEILARMRASGKKEKEEEVYFNVEPGN